MALSSSADRAGRHRFQKQLQSARVPYMTLANPAHAQKNAAHSKTRHFLAPADVPNRRLRCAAVEFLRARDFCRRAQIDPSGSRCGARADYACAAKPSTVET